jgi:hypothetical protein
MRDVRRLFMSILVGGFLVAGFLMPGRQRWGRRATPLS